MSKITYLYSLTKKESVLLTTVLWFAVMVPSFLIGWNMLDFNPFSFEMTFLWFMAIIPAFLLSQKIENLSLNKKNKTIIFYFFLMVSSLALSFIAMNIDYSNYYNLTKKALTVKQSFAVPLIFSIILFSFVVLIFSLENNHNKKAPMPWWLNMLAIALISSSISFASQDLARAHQSNPFSFWGWINKRNNLLEDYRFKHISGLEMYNNLAKLEDIRKKMDKNNEILPKSAFLTYQELCSLDKMEEQSCRDRFLSEKIASDLHYYN